MRVCAALSPFGGDLDDYLKQLARPDGRRGCPDVEKVRSRLIAYDLSNTGVKLVACVPGYHKAGDLGRYGHMRLRALLQREPVPASSAPTVICQFSSQGSVSEDWLASEFAASVCPSACRQGTLQFGRSPSTASPATAGGKSGAPTLQLVWPRVEDVRNSLDGWYAGTRVVWWCAG